MTGTVKFRLKLVFDYDNNSVGIELCQNSMNFLWLWLGNSISRNRLNWIGFKKKNHLSGASTNNEKPRENMSDFCLIRQFVLSLVVFKPPTNSLKLSSSGFHLLRPPPVSSGRRWCATRRIFRVTINFLLSYSYSLSHFHSLLLFPTPPPPPPPPPTPPLLLLPPPPGSNGTEERIFFPFFFLNNNKNERKHSRCTIVPRSFQPILFQIRFNHIWHRVKSVENAEWHRGRATLEASRKNFQNTI